MGRLRLIEWPDRLGDLAPKSALTLAFSSNETPEHRLIEAQWADQRWDCLPDIINV